MTARAVIERVIGTNCPDVAMILAALSGGADVEHPRAHLDRAFAIHIEAFGEDADVARSH